MYDLSVKINNYKCFKDEAGFECIKRVNLIIGRNNAGKSALLDIIENVVAAGQHNFDQTTWRKSPTPPQVIFGSEITKDVVDMTFPKNTTGGSIGGNHNEFGQRYIGSKLKWARSGPQQAMLISCDDTINPPLRDTEYATKLPGNIQLPLDGKKFKRMLAERDITPETSRNDALNISPNGNGLTNAIQCFLHRSNLPRDLVKGELLNALNEIFTPNTVFTEIFCQRHDNEHWEIYLEEEHKGPVALSKSGSGLKTVVMVLAYIFLFPKIEAKLLNQYVFGFEELENNIHPALLRRLNDYIYNSSKKNDFIYFMTTHSNVLIDQFSRQDDAQIIHVTQFEGKSECNTVKTYIENNGILDDLDVRASDLLQANGIIWVEGPSDRIYLNKWIELWSEGKLKEGTHYQIIFYGGRLLSHLSAESPEMGKEGISILNTNRNAIIMIDSDKKIEGDEVNVTKRRIIQEFKKLDSLFWITEGREIENYIPSDVVDRFLNTNDSPEVGQYDSFFEYMDSLKEGEGSKYTGKKPLLAENLIRNMEKKTLIPMLDLDEKLKDVCLRIRSWNS